MNDLSVLEPVTREVTFQGALLNVSPLKVGQIPSFIKAIRPMFTALAGALVSSPPGEGTGEGGDFDMSMESLLNLLADHGDALIVAVAIATKIEKQKLEDADTGEFISLLRAVVEVNADFFGRAVATAKKEVGQSLSSS